MAQTAIDGVINGVDVERMGNTIQAINGNPGLAKFQFRALNRWNNGSQNRTTIAEFYGAGQENPQYHRFTLDADEPDVLLGRDAAPNPVEYVLTALAGCLTTSIVYHAAARHQSGSSGVQPGGRTGSTWVFGPVRSGTKGLSEHPRDVQSEGGRTGG
ncbi:MAG: hypothetical protein C4294_05510, partial [Nitrospiraceae bacterium]